MPKKSKEPISIDTKTTVNTNKILKKVPSTHSPIITKFKKKVTKGGFSEIPNIYFRSTIYENSRFKSSIIYRIFFHTEYMIDIAINLMKFNKHQPNNLLSEKQNAVERQVIENALPCIAHSMGFDFINPNHPSYRININKTLAGFETMIQYGGTQDFIFFMMFAIKWEKTLSELISQITDKAEFEYTMTLLNNVIGNHTTQTYLSRVTVENKHQTIVDFNCNVACNFITRSKSCGLDFVHK